MRGPDERKTGEILKDVEPDDLLKFGLIPEFVGRLPVVATLDDLDEDALVEILTKPKNALVKQYQRLFEMEDVRLELDRRRAARRSPRRRSRARPARAACARSWKASCSTRCSSCRASHGVSEIVINREVVEGRAKPLHIYSDRRGDVGTGA